MTRTTSPRIVYADENQNQYENSSEIKPSVGEQNVLLHRRSEQYPMGIEAVAELEESVLELKQNFVETTSKPKSLSLSSKGGESPRDFIGIVSASDSGRFLDVVFAISHRIFRFGNRTEKTYNTQ